MSPQLALKVPDTPGDLCENSQSLAFSHSDRIFIRLSKQFSVQLVAEFSAQLVDECTAF